MSEEIGPNFSEPPTLPNPPREDDVTQMRRMSRRSFVMAGIAVAAAYGALRWIDATKDDEGVKKPLREALRFNEGVWSALYSSDRLVPTYDAHRVTGERVNGDDGLGDDFDPEDWSLKLVGVHGHEGPVELTMKDILKLPSMEMITEFFCIEGWSVIQRFKGVAMKEFMKRYPPATLSGAAPDLGKPHDLVPYVGMSTPTYQKEDGSEDRYFVGLDMQSALHAQTMLCYEMNGKPLTLEHGAPLRLVIPTKYGVKNIKRIAVITYSKTRPDDFWAKEGYDWYAGL